MNTANKPTYLFDVIIPTYNNLDELKECLDGFTIQSIKNFRVIVCVDGSDDGTQGWLQMQSYSFIMLVLEHPDKRNHGRNPTRNLALNYLDSEFLCFIDSDCTPHPHLLEEHLRILQQYEPCISVGDIRYTNTTKNTWAWYAGRRGKNKYNDGEIIPYYYVTTGNLAHKTSLFVTLNGQDELMTRYGGGDTEYALRLYSLFRLPVVFNARAYSHSEMNKTLETALQQMTQFGANNLHYIEQKHPSEKKIFGLEIFYGKGIKELLIKFLLLLPLSGVLQRISTIIPANSTGLIAKCKELLINYLVMQSIYKGWRSR
jgi:glycosyltransferase involved in cell wall biosynthesis